MPTEIKLWRIDGEHPVTISREKLDLESRIEEWLRQDIGLVSDNLLVIGQQVSTDYGGSIDLLAIDHVGNLVVLELKRDKTPRDIVAQVLDYASWVQGLNHESI
jgi:RecB family endonuclease NucS